MNDGRYIDQLGFGIWSIPADQTAAPVSSALGLGYRLVDGVEFASKPVTDAAARTGKSPAQVVLRWLIQRELTVITRSINPARQAENLNVCDFELTDAEMTAIATLDKGLRTGPDPSVFKLM